METGVTSLKPLKYSDILNIIPELKSSAHVTLFDKKNSLGDALASGMLESLTSAMIASSETSVQASMLYNKRMLNSIDLSVINRMCLVLYKFDMLV